MIAQIVTLTQAAVLLPNLSMTNPIKKQPKISPKPKAIMGSAAYDY